MILTYNGPVDGPLFVFAHGAGAGSDSHFMENIAQGLALRGIRVARFNFPYMQQAIDNGNRRPPERADKLIVQYAALVAGLAQPMVIGGKSMGGRIASLLIAQLAGEMADSDEKFIKGVACLGFPFHPQGKPEKLRIDHFPLIKKNMLIVQGERDALGSKTEVQGYGLANNIEWLWLEDGDHSLKPRGKSGFSEQQHIQRALDTLAAFIKKVMAS